MNTDTYLKIEGLTGESVEVDHVGWIQLTAFEWSIAHRSGLPGGGPEVRDLVFTKLYDQTSPELALACAEGRLFPTATMEITRPTGGERFAFMRYILRNCLVSSVSPTGSPDERGIYESVSIAFEEIEWGYSPLLPDGT